MSPVLLNKSFYASEDTPFSSSFAERFFLALANQPKTRLLQTLSLAELPDVVFLRFMLKNYLIKAETSTSLLSLIRQHYPIDDTRGSDVDRAANIPINTQHLDSVAAISRWGAPEVFSEH